MKQITLNQGIKGYFRLVKHKADAEGNPIPGTEVVAADWFPNLITDGGLNLYAGSGVYCIENCRVGTGSTAPAVTDVALVNQVGTRTYDSGAGESTVESEHTTAPYYGAVRRTYRFATGAAAGNLAEVGVGQAPLHGNILFSRALIVDALGNPTTITVLSDEILDVTYELRAYPSTSDVEDSIVLDGITYNTTLRMALGASGSLTSVNTPWVPGAASSSMWSGGCNSVAYGADAVLGTIATLPTATSSQQFASGLGDNRQTVQAYVNNSYYRDVLVSFGLTDANVTGGIGAMVVAREQIFAWQIKFDPVVPKTNTKIMTLTVRTIFARL